MQAEALLQLVVELGVRQSDEARRRPRVRSVHTIELRLWRKRQDRERAAGQEMLLGAAVMVALVGDAS